MDHTFGGDCQSSDVVGTHVHVIGGCLCVRSFAKAMFLRLVEAGFPLRIKETYIFF